MQIEPFRHLPSPRWSICTSATRKYALAALKAAGVPVPDVLVAAEDVVAGKPQYATAVFVVQARIEVIL